MMAKLKLTTKLKDEKGNNIGERIQCLVLNSSNEFMKRADGGLLVSEIDDPTKERTLKAAICESLLFEDPKNPLSGEEKNKRYQLWLLISNSKESVDLKSEEITIIKDCIGKVQPILIAGQCISLLEGDK